jgi:hypothetical protein
MVDAALPGEAFQGDQALDISNMAVSSWISAGTPPQPACPLDLWASEWHQRFDQSDNRRKLTWRDRFTNAVPLIDSFYSSTEEALERYPGDPPSWLLDGILTSGMLYGRYSWVVQEKAKGNKFSLLCGIVAEGSDYGGWGFNLTDPLSASDPSWYEVREEHLGAGDYARFPITPTGNLTPELLNGTRRSPLFKTGWGRWDHTFPIIRVVDESTHEGPEWIHDLYQESTGSNLAADPAKRNQMLAEAFPALTLAAGANNTAAFEERNHDLPAQCASDAAVWPRGLKEGTELPKWLHSDMREVAYFYVSTLFDQVVAISKR